MSSPSKHTVVFIHGLWLHPQSWRPWIDLFDKNGYAATAPGWPGVADTVEATRAHPDDIAGRGIEEITDRYRELISGMERLPILIGHSFGGLIATKLLMEEQATAVISIDAAQMKGGLPAPLAVLHSSLPALKDPASKHQAIALSSAQFRESFGVALDAAESDELWERWAIPAPGLPLFEAESASFEADSPIEIARHSTTHAPLLVITSGSDESVAKAIRKAAAKQSGHSRDETDVVEFADHCHSLTIDHGWQDVAEACLSWLEQHGM
jgi:alpha-beta hydrolase superfamily lysophospholipase